MVDSMRFWDIWVSFSLISDISNEPIVMISMVRDNLYTTIRELHTVLSFHNSMFILTLCLGKVSAICISTTILISKWLRGELFLMVWSWVWSWVVRSRSWVVRSRFGVGFVGRSSRCMIRSNLTFILHISNVSIFMVSSVSDNLGSTIRKGNTVFTSYYTVIILSFLFGKVSTRVFVFDTIFIGKGPRGQFIFRSWVVRGRLVNRCMVRSRGWVVRSRVVRGMIGHSHSHDRSQQHFAQHDYFFNVKVK